MITMDIVNLQWIWLLKRLLQFFPGYRSINKRLAQKRRQKKERKIYSEPTVSAATLPFKTPLASKLTRT